ncbi:hypothetical protein EGW08_006979 [Elysia chlorotica]|uniref:Centromere protein K n=1 Tax=Elysia chlorotica TaxID=188477 RepID=A0A3S0ZT49_ELYCH|nr:hypothetical protein EGW08_006979 [Elysia chlorotica]
MMDAEDIVEQCTQDWQRVKGIQANLQGVASKSVPSDQPLLQVLEETEKRLKGELQNIRERELSTIPPNKEMQALIVKQSEQQSLQEHKETLAFLRATRADTVESLRKSEAEFEQLKQVNEEIKKKLLAFEEAAKEKRDNASLEAVLTEMKTKVAKVAETDRYFKRALKEIVATRCPAPEPNIVRSTLNESQDVDPDQIMNMKRMLGRLIEQTLNSPEQPYIELDHQAWPAQVEFLLKCQVAVQHPDDPRRLKLVPFHL